MVNSNKKTNSLLLISMMVLLTVCGNGSYADDKQQSANQNNISKQQIGSETAIKIKWGDLLSEQYHPDKIIAKYQDQIDKFGAEDYSPEAEALYQKINDEMNNAPVNKALNNKNIKLPGFIAPLNQHNGFITEFLLVPYFGACIHVPPPPINQTVLVKVAADKGIKIEDSFGAFWVSGQIRIDGKKTDIGEAGYNIENAVIEVYAE
jgi:hypothetical protein